MAEEQEHAASFAMDESDLSPMSPPPGGKGRMVLSLGLRVLLPILLLVGGAYGFSKLSVKEELPPPPRPKPRDLEVEVMPLAREDYQILIPTQGAIRAHSEVNLTAQVGGRIVQVNPAFEEGAFFKKGDILLELDEIDFEVALVSAETQLAQARLSLDQEKTRATQARLDWEDLGYDEEPSDLVLRKPHVALAERQVKLAEAQKKSAERNLERAKVKAPFDGRVLTRTAGVGQSIGAGTALGVIFATDYSEVRLPLSTRMLERLTVPEDESDPALEITLRDGLSTESEARWMASILRTEGALDANTLELFAIARIQDPFGRREGTENELPLRVGQPVMADVPGETLDDVFVVPRDVITSLNRIRVVDSKSLRMFSFRIKQLWANDEVVVFREEKIKEGMLLVTTQLPYAPEGAKVIIIENELPPDELGDTATAGVQKGARTP